MRATTQRNEASSGATVPRAAERRVERRIGLPSGRAVLGGLLMAVAAVGTFLAYTSATADDAIDVLIATRPLSAGETITTHDVELVAADLPSEVRGLFGTADAAVGRQIVASVGEGEFLQASATVTPVEGDEALEISVTLPGSRAVGRLQPGERVDVFSTWSGDVTELVAVDARVLEASGGASGLVQSGSEQVVVRLALADFDQVEAIVHAQAAGDITMIRAALGTEAQEIGREYRPLVGVANGSDDPDADKRSAEGEKGD